jgi:hypothetical protein
MRNPMGRSLLMVFVSLLRKVHFRAKIPEYRDLHFYKSIINNISAFSPVEYIIRFWLCFLNFSILQDFSAVNGLRLFVAGSPISVSRRQNLCFEKRLF